MTYALRLAPAAHKDLSYRLPEAMATAALEFHPRPVAREPAPGGQALAQGAEGLVGNPARQYRVIYSTLDEVVVVVAVRVSHRADAYH